MRMADNFSTMLSLKKRYVVIAGILGGFAIAFQDSTVSVWQQLQTQTRCALFNFSKHYQHAIFGRTHIPLRT